MSDTRTPIVMTAAGPVRGVIENDIHVVRGIRYAEAPVGELRFRAPQPPTPWTEPVDAVAFPPAAIQHYSPLALPESFPRSEDCLFVNVWSGDLDGSAPVIVFIHGGGFTTSYGGHPWYDGSALVRDGGVVVVNLQYRLGPFGWLDASDLGPEYAGSANNGLRDQMLALRWVRENIARFGGDPQNVIVVGESAGAISLSALLGVPEADDLYDRVILQSGTPGTVGTREWSAGVAEAMREFAKTPTSRELIGLSSDAILDAVEKHYLSRFADTAFHPIIDGVVLHDHPARRIASPDGPSKPIIIGATLDEARYWLYLIPYAVHLPLRCSRQWLESIAGERADAVTAAYRAERPDLTSGQLNLAMIGDVGFRMPAMRMADALAARGVEVYHCLATAQTADLDGIMGAAHAVELPMVFGTVDAATPFLAATDANRDLSARIRQLWVSFARDVGRDSRRGLEHELPESTLISARDVRHDADSRRPHPAGHRDRRGDRHVAEHHLLSRERDAAQARALQVCAQHRGVGDRMHGLALERPSEERIEPRVAAAREESLADARGVQRMPPAHPPEGRDRARSSHPAHEESLGSSRVVAAQHREVHVLAARLIETSEVRQRALAQAHRDGRELTELPQTHAERERAIGATVEHPELGELESKAVAGGTGEPGAIRELRCRERLVVLRELAEHPERTCEHSYVGGHGGSVAISEIRSVGLSPGTRMTRSRPAAQGRGAHPGRP